MSSLFEYEHTSWSENCSLCVQLKHRADAAIHELEAALANMDDKRGFQLTKRLKAEDENKLLRERLDDCLRGHYGLNPAKGEKP